MKKLILALIASLLIYQIPAYSNTQTPAKDITVNTSSFGHNLNSSDTDVQKSLNTLDQNNGGGVNPGTNGDFSYYATTGNVVSGQPNLTVNGNGNIGVGTSNAQQTLQVNGIAQSALFVGPGAIGTLTQNTLPKAGSFYNLVDSVITELNGNIGIGNSPAQKLDVNGTVKSLNAIIGSLNGILKGTSGAVGTATSGTDYAPATSGTSILKGNNSGGFANAVAGTDYQTPLTFSTGLTNSAGNVVVNNSQNIAQLSNLTSNGLITTTGGVGNLSITPFSGVLGLWETNSVGIDTFNPVGIGSTSPSQQLDVVGTIRGKAFQGSGSGAMQISSNQGIGLDSVNNTYTTPVLLLSTGGNVGVGSPTPGQILDVVGTVRTTGFQLSTNPTSGYIMTANSVGVGTWAPAPASGGTPGGSTPQLQYNNSGVFGGVSGSGIVGNNVGIGSVNPEYGLVAYNGAKINGTGPSEFTANVGIFTANAGQALDIVGTARMQGFTMTTSPSSGYVLKSDASGNGSWSAGSSGSVTSVGLSSPNGTLQIGSSPVTTSGTITGDVNWQAVNLIASIGTGGINWASINSIAKINSGGINWPGIGNYSSGFMKWNGSNPPSQDTNTYLTGNQTITLSGAVTGSGATSFATTLANTIVQAANVNWQDFKSGQMNSSGMNWNNVNGLGPVNSGGINWNNIPTFAVGTVLTAINTNSANWSNNMLVSGTITEFNQGNVAIGSTSPSFPLQVVGNVGVGTTASMGTNPNQLIINNGAYFNNEYSYAGNIGVGTTTINWNYGSNQNIGIGTSQGDYIAFTHPSNSNAAKLQLRILEDSTGSRVIQFWPSTVKWSGGTAPTLSAATKSDIVNCFWNGTSDYCQSSTNF
jgi:hypothetical protein